MVCAGQELPEEFASTLSSSLGGLLVKICSPASIVEDTGLSGNGITAPPTACAVGLALRAAGDASFPLNINLLPEMVVRIREFKKHSLVTASIAFFLLLMSLLTVGMIYRDQTALEERMQEVQRGLAGFVQSDTSGILEDEIALLALTVEEEREFLNAGEPDISWKGLLSHIRRIIPEDVRVTSLESERSHDFLVEGEALSIDSVYRFAAALEDSEFFITAKLTRLDSAQDDDGGLLRYTIKCLLKCNDKKEK
jgi:Tfp pilus assembly protein PilN